MSDIKRYYTRAGFPGSYWEKKAERERHDNDEEQIPEQECGD